MMQNPPRAASEYLVRIVYSYVLQQFSYYELVEWMVLKAPPLAESEIARKCPACGSTRIVRIVYGLVGPGHSFGVPPLEWQRDVAGGGCVVFPHSPRRHCHACRHSFGASSWRNFGKTRASRRCKSRKELRATWRQRRKELRRESMKLRREEDLRHRSLRHWSFVERALPCAESEYLVRIVYSYVLQQFSYYELVEWMVLKAPPSYYELVEWMVLKAPPLAESEDRIARKCPACGSTRITGPHNAALRYVKLVSRTSHFFHRLYCHACEHRFGASNLIFKTRASWRRKYRKNLRATWRQNLRATWRQRQKMCRVFHRSIEEHALRLEEHRRAVERAFWRHPFAWLRRHLLAGRC